MNRRGFIKHGVAVSLAAAGTGLMLPACTRNLRAELMAGRGKPEALNGITSQAVGILSYAALAPSGHNSQPWFVRPVSEREWIIGSDRNRRLPEVDRDNREVMLSLGAFTENLVQAAAASGFHTEVDILAADRFEPDVVKVILHPAPPCNIPLQRLETRRTVKTGLLSRELAPADVQAFSKASGGHLHYFPAGSRHSDLMVQAAIENFKVQFENEAAMAEAARWTRFSDRDARKFRDGLTPDGMEITGIAGFYVRHFSNPEDAAGRMFRQKAMEKAAAQAGQGGGWMVITSDGETVPDLIESGRRFQRMALLARERKVAIHPMTQTLEEDRGRIHIRQHHAATMIPQFMIRVGYVNRYPDPVSVRRPVAWFLVS